MRFIIAATVASTMALTPLLAADNEPAKRLNDAAVVFSEVMDAPDKGIPQELLEKAHCIVIVPDLKTAAFVVGGKYGKGYLSCRNTGRRVGRRPARSASRAGAWASRSAVRPTDLIMLVMSERGADKLLASKFTLGAEGSVAAGPVGRTATAQTDAQMRADILSWSRTQGLFAGVALEGATLREDLDDNATLYGKKLENRGDRDERSARAQRRRQAARAAEPVLGQRTPHGLVESARLPQGRRCLGDSHRGTVDAAASGGLLGTGQLRPHPRRRIELGQLPARSGFSGNSVRSSISRKFSAR